MFNLRTDCRPILERIKNYKASMKSSNAKYLITSGATFEELRRTRAYRAVYNNSGVPIPTIYGLKVLLDNDLEFGDVEVR